MKPQVKKSQTARNAPSRPGVTDDRVVIEVKDTGTWRDDLVEGDRGRGTSIMRAVMDDVDIRTDRHGTVVTLRRRVHGPGRRPPSQRE